MLILVLFSLISGIVTVLSPCVLPVLPIVLSSSASSGKRRPLGVITGLIISFSIFTLAISQIVRLLGISATTLRYVAIGVIGVLGLSMIIPQLNTWLEKLLSFIPNMVKNGHKEGNGFVPGFLTGLSLGLVWAPCAGPILASVTALAATQEVSFASVLVVVSYAIGSGIPLLAIAYGGRSLIQKVPFLSKNLGRVQKGFGVMMIITAALIALNVDIFVTTWLTQTFPTGISSRLSAFETSNAVIEQLDAISGQVESASYFTTDADVLPTGSELPILGEAPEITGISNWLNSEPLTLEALRGKVVIVDFWTYSCINCVRTLPYLTDWHAKYADDGLVILGIHTPEFEFEKSAKNVEDALKRFDIAYPVAQDNDYLTWRAYSNRYWPAKYIVDAEGNIRYTHFGEGKYEETELVIQQLLAEIGANSEDDLTEKIVKNYSEDQTPETYLGYGRQETFYSPEAYVPEESSTYTFPENLPLHRFALSGNWIFDYENVQAAGENAQLKLHFSGKDVFLVMDSALPGQVAVEMSNPEIINSAPDVDEFGKVTIDGARLYHLVSLNEVQDTEVILTFENAGIQAFAFTFGS